MDAYLRFRKQVLDYTNIDMNLKLENDEQVYIAVFDVPIDSNIIGADTQTYALVFGLNTHVYLRTGDLLTGLGKRKCNESHAVIIDKCTSGLRKNAIDPECRIL